MNGKKVRFLNHRVVLTGILLAAAFFFLGSFFAAGEADYYLRIYRSIDTYGKVYKEIAVNYVDTVDPEEFMRAGIDGMLKTLDPYTVYIGEKENDEIDLMTTGKYGGVGITIGMRDGVVTVINLLDGYSAAKQGVDVGDKITAVDGSPTKGLSLEGVRQLVRGPLGTELKLTVEREGERKPIEFVLMREEISVRNVTYAGYVAPGLGYIRLERFSRTAGEDMRAAIKDLQAGGDLQGIVLDLRDNPGGLLESAVDVVSKFVPDGSLIVSTRGRKSDSDRKYFSSEIPMTPKIPVAVLVNKMSASASEIVTGAVQDMDRGVIIGTRTFGKGLVQTITRISETSSLKMTTARYYTPSGRCIQEIDYWHRDDDGNGTTVPDSLRKEFRTAHNRPVWEGGGILPDTVVHEKDNGAYLAELQRKAMFFKYANHYAAVKKIVPDKFTVSDSVIDDFDSFLKEKGFVFQEEAESKLNDLRTLASDARYDKSFLDGIKTLESVLQVDKERQIHRYQEEVRAALKTEILARIKGDRARYESTFADDRQLQAAIGILKNHAVYNKLLAVKSR